MKLENESSVFNMGDTSIRVRQVVDVNKVVLALLLPYTQIHQWESNPANQESFYQSFLSEIVKLEEEQGTKLFQDFNRSEDYIPPTDKIGLRGRTLTNALIKSGFIFKDRTVSEIGRDYINNDLIPDELEGYLNLKLDNLAYFRQYLKLKVFNPAGDKAFFCFRFAIKFLVEYQDVTQDHFLKILLSIKPDFNEIQLNTIIGEYQRVATCLLYTSDAADE